MRLFDFFHFLKREERGSVAVEMALTAIILTVLVMGGFEGARAVMVEQKLDRVAGTVADLASRAETLSATDLSNIYSASKQVMQPFSMDTDGKVIVTVVTGANPSPLITWQKVLGGSAVSTSKIGTAAGAKASLPAGFTLDVGESVVVAEVYYNYQPIMTSDMFSIAMLYQTAFSRPRLVDYPVLN